jgi:hypothetical protein
MTTMIPAAFDYHAPRSIDEATAHPRDVNTPEDYAALLRERAASG